MQNKFLSRRLVIGFHADQIERFGGSSGIRDIGLLESALEQPKASFGGEFLHPTVYLQAAAYLFHLVKNHPFVDGNKRVAFAAMDVFLRINDLSLDLDDETAYALVIDTATGVMDKQAIADLIEKYTHPSETGADVGR